MSLKLIEKSLLFNYFLKLDKLVKLLDEIQKLMIGKIITNYLNTWS